MRIAPCVLIWLLCTPGIAHSQVVCAPIASTASIGNLSARPAKEAFMYVVPVRCTNAGTAPVKENVMVSIDQNPLEQSNEEFGTTTLPMRLRFKTVSKRLETHRCLEIELQAGESRVFDVPIIVELSISSPRHGDYRATVPITATAKPAQSRATLQCP